MSNRAGGKIPFRKRNTYVICQKHKNSMLLLKKAFQIINIDLQFNVKEISTI